MADRKAMVTGASEGIGRAFVHKLVDEGYFVTGVARSHERLASLQEEVGPQRFSFIEADLTQRADVEKVKVQLSEGRYDLLINNAGFGSSGPFHTTPIETSQAMIELNVQTLVALAHTFLNHAKRGDTLVNISSVLAFAPKPNSAVYAATKAFVTSFSESLWFEQKERGIYVLGFCPGATRTNFFERAGATSDDMPKGMTQSAEEVVAHAWAAIQERDRPTAVSGRKNLTLSSVTRVLPRKSIVSLMGRMN